MSAVYPKALELFASGGCNLTSDTIKCCLLNSAYNSAHQFRSSLTGVAGGTHPTLASKTITNGIFDAADTTMVAVSAGAAVTAVVVYKDTGNAATDPLLAYDDMTSITPNGGDILITWANVAPAIFAL